MKLPLRSRSRRAPAPPDAPLLRQQKQDFTDEGSPPPGRVGIQVPVREAPEPGDVPPRRR
jgi:hypothetical protein